MLDKTNNYPLKGEGEGLLLKSLYSSMRFKAFLERTQGVANIVAQVMSYGADKSLWSYSWTYSIHVPARLHYSLVL